MAQRRFPADVVEAIGTGKILALRAGSGPHRFIGLWSVVVEGRVFVRSWSLRPGGWYRALLQEPHGAIQVGGRELAFRAVRTRSERLRRAVDRAYSQKYHTPGALRYVRDLSGPESRATTTELVPL